MQVVSSSWNATVSGTNVTLGFGILIGWQRITASGVNFFTIGTSLIGGGDIIKAGGNAISFWDKYLLTDYSDHASSIATEQIQAQYPWGMMLGQADIELDNSDNKFLPGFDPIIGSGILPGRPMKVSLGLNGEIFQQFTGVTDRPQNVIGSEKTTKIHAYDFANYLNSYTSGGSGVLTSSGVYVNQYADKIIGDLLGEAGLNSNQYILDQSLQKPIGYLAPAGLQSGQIINDLASAEGATAFVDENGIFRFWNRQHSTTNSGIQFTLTYSGIVSINLTDAPIYNDVTVTAMPRTVQAKQIIWQLSASVLVSPNSTTTIEADFSDDQGALPVTGLDQPVPVGSSNGSSNFIANTAQDGSGSDATSSITLAGANLAATSYVMTFANATSQPIYITSVTLYGTPAKVTNIIAQRYKDQPSIDQFGTNPGNNYQPLTITNNYIQDPDTANGLGYILVNDYKNAQSRVVLDNMFANPALQFGDQIMVYDQATASGINYFLLGRRNQVSADGELSQQLTLEKRLNQKYFQIGVSIIGGTDMIAP